MGAARTSDTVFDYLQKNANLDVSVKDIAAGTKLTTSQVQTAMNNLKTRNGGVGITTIMAGRIWRYTPSGTPTVAPAAPPVPVKAELFECVGRDSAGTCIVRGEDGNLFRLVQL